MLHSIREKLMFDPCITLQLLGNAVGQGVGGTEIKRLWNHRRRNTTSKQRPRRSIAVAVCYWCKKCLSKKGSGRAILIQRETKQEQVWCQSRCLIMLNHIISVSDRYLKWWWNNLKALSHFDRLQFSLLTTWYRHGDILNFTHRLQVTESIKWFPQEYLSII